MFSFFITWSLTQQFVSSVLLKIDYIKCFIKSAFWKYFQSKTRSFTGAPKIPGSTLWYIYHDKT